MADVVKPTFPKVKLNVKRGDHIAGIVSDLMKEMRKAGWPQESLDEARIRINKTSLYSKALDVVQEYGEFA